LLRDVRRRVRPHVFDGCVERHSDHLKSFSRDAESSERSAGESLVLRSDDSASRLNEGLTMDFQTQEHDVIVIGAGGAGLRAAIEASASGVSVGLICKALLGKAHTVMAEGGIAAALANVDDRDNWKVIDIRQRRGDA